jgi:hypothetical protein
MTRRHERGLPLPAGFSAAAPLSPGGATFTYGLQKVPLYVSPRRTEPTRNWSAERLSTVAGIFRQQGQPPLDLLLAVGEAVLGEPQRQRCSLSTTS